MNKEREIKFIEEENCHSSVNSINLIEFCVSFFFQLGIMDNKGMYRKK